MRAAHAFCNTTVTRNLQVTITSTRLQYKDCISGWWAVPGWLSFACPYWWKSTWKETPCNSCWLKRRCLADAGREKKQKNKPQPWQENSFSILLLKHFAFPVISEQQQYLKCYPLSHACQQSASLWTDLAKTGALVRNSLQNKRRLALGKAVCVRRLWKTMCSEDDVLHLAQ